MERDGLSGRERELVDQIAAEERLVVSADHVMSFWKVSRAAANSTLSRLAKKGWLQRLRRGTYTAVPLGSLTDTPAIAAAWPIAAQLFAPCFISGWSAAEHWGLTDQIFNVVSVVTAHPQRARDQRVGGIRFRTRTLRPEKMFGDTPVWFGSARVHVADPHRTMIDILDAPDFGGGGRHAMDIAQAYWRSSLADADAVLEYAAKFDRGTVFKRLGLTAEVFGTPSDRWVKRCADGCTAGISLLDPSAPNNGPLRSRWGIRLNIPVGGS